MVTVARNKRFNRYGARFARGAMTAVNVMARYKRMRGGSYSRTKKSRSGTGVTRQNDTKLQYRKKYMPKYKKRRWVNFSKKVHAVTSKEEGTKTVVFNKAYAANKFADVQDFNAFYLYGTRNNNSGNELGGADLQYIYNNTTNLADATDKLKFKSAVLDMTFTNTGTTKLEVDLYHVTFYGMGKVASLATANTNAAAETTIIGTSGGTPFNSVNLSRRGVTPFDMPELIRNMQCTIQKKIKYFVEPTTEFTYQIRDAKEHQVSEYNVIAGNQALAMPKVTQGILLITKSITGDAADAFQYQARVTRKYSFTDGTHSDASGWITY